jgi:hypothetical protein
MANGSIQCLLQCPVASRPVHKLHVITDNSSCTEGDVAVWADDGELCGPSGGHGDDQNTTPRAQWRGTRMWSMHGRGDPVLLWPPQFSRTTAAVTCDISSGSPTFHTRATCGLDANRMPGIAPSTQAQGLLLRQNYSHKVEITSSSTSVIVESVPTVSCVCS